MKKIFFLNSCQDWGGGEKWTFEVAENLDQKQYEVIVGSVESSELYKRSQKAGIKTRKVPVKGSFSVLNPFKLVPFVKYLQREMIDIIFLNLSQDLKFGAIAGHLAGVDRIIYRRGSAIPIKDRFYTKFLLEDCVTDIIANSRATKETILENTSEWLSQDKIEIIYNGLKIEEIEQKKDMGPDIRSEFGIDEGTILIANVGRLSRQKGHKYLLEAVSIMKEKISDFVVLIVGTGELEAEIKEMAAEKGLENYLIFTGFRDDVYNIMNQLDFLLHTALWEGFGYVVAEAMAVGIPVVSTDVSNISEIMVDGETGYLAESKNPGDIADKAIKMYYNENKKELGNRGRVIIERKFTFQQMIKEIECNYLK